MRRAWMIAAVTFGMLTLSQAGQSSNIQQEEGENRNKGGAQLPPREDPAQPSNLKVERTPPRTPLSRTPKLQDYERYSYDKRVPLSDKYW